MIYHLLKPLIRLLLNIFFRKIVVTGRENVPSRGPLIIVANHPNTFIDPLLIASIIDRRIGFLGNVGIFSNKILASVLRHFHVIPIFRKKDVSPGEKPDNNASFQMCHQYLSEGNTLLIFPEGSSYYELKLRDIKTGTARIALSYEALKNFQGQLRILPIALDYSDSIQFHSMVSVTISPPINLGTYQSGFLKDEAASVRKLTEGIKSALAEHVPHTDGKVEEDLLLKIHKFYTAYYETEADIYADAKRSLILRAQLSKAMRKVENLDHDLYIKIQEKVFTFFSLLKRHNLTPGFLTEQFYKESKWLVMLRYLSEFVILLPFYITGLLSNYIPYILPYRVFKLSGLEIEYKASVQMFTGMVSFPIFYSVILWICKPWLGSEVWIYLLVTLAFIISGYIAKHYWTQVNRFKRIIRFYFVIPTKERQRMIELRNEIFSNIEKARCIIAG